MIETHWPSRSRPMSGSFVAGAGDGRRRRAVPVHRPPRGGGGCGWSLDLLDVLIHAGPRPRAVWAVARRRAPPCNPAFSRPATPRAGAMVLAGQLDHLEIRRVGQRDREALDARLHERAELLGDLVGAARDHHRDAALGQRAVRLALLDPAHRVLVAGAEVQRGQPRAGDLRRVATDVLAVALEHAHEMADLVDVTHDVAAVGVLGDEAQRLALAAAADRGSGCRRAGAAGCSARP